MSSNKSKSIDDDDHEMVGKSSQLDYLKKVKQLYSHDVSFFINRNKKYMTELEQIDESLKSKLDQIGTKLRKNDKVFQLIMNSFHNIKNYNYDKRTFTKEERILMANNIKSVLLAIDTFFSFYLKEDVKKNSKIIENLLFKLIFNPIKDKSNTTNVYSVYLKHDDFINNQNSFVNFKSSTGSGKTRCAPFFFAIRMIEEGMDKPFFIMTQPSYSIILDKIKDFKNILGSSVYLVKDNKEMLSLYLRYFRLVSENKTNTKLFQKYFSKPIIGLFSPHILLTLISKTDKKGIDIVSCTRFCLDEFHERSVDTDVLIAVLSDKMKKMVQKRTNFPMQVLMMSATPDSRVLRCFGNVDELSLPNSQLFNIEDINITVEAKSKVNPEVISQTFGVIKKMASKTLDVGHILIFTSGNSRITDIQNHIISDCEMQCKDEDTIVKVIKDFEVMLKGKTIEQFYKKLDNYIYQQEKSVSKRKKVLFVLPIRYLGYVSDEQKEIGKNSIPNHDNVVKVIIATNAIESSITINNLAAVIDSCLFNKPFYDKDKGLTTLEEHPISIQSHTQRRGRVGRVRPGIYVKIMIQNTSLIDLLPPQIQTTDITLNILSLRSIGFDLEKITNLPNNIEKTDMDRYISELESFGALDKPTHQITNLGKLLGSFSGISPFIVSAILKVAGYNVEDKNEDEKDKTTVIRVLLGFLISLIFGDSQLCFNSYSPKLQENYDKESDISTILMTFLDLMHRPRREVKECSEEYGFNSRNVSAIIGQIIQTAELLPFFKKQKKEAMKKREEEENDENKKDEEIVVDVKDTNDNEIINQENESNESIKIVETEDTAETLKKNKKKAFDPNMLTRKTIFKHLYQYAKELRNNHRLNEFITELIYEIGKNKPEWKRCRIVQFLNIENLYINPSIIYEGDASLTFEAGQKALIYMRMRPGTFGLDCPVTGYILSIAHEENVHMNFGSFFHYDKSLPMADSIIHPMSIQCPLSVDNDFSDPLIEGYLSEDEDNFKKFCRGRCVGADDGNILFFRSQGISSNQENDGNGHICSIFTFIPKNKNAINIFTNALKVIEKLIPYTPSTILVPDYLLKCFISIRGVGTDKIDSSVHLFKENQYHAYQINHGSLKYALENIEKLKSPIEKMTIAITGENYSYQISNNEEDDDNDKSKQYNRINSPHASSKCTSVFSNDPFFYSHLVILSTEKISSSNYKLNELTWLKSGISVEFSNEELIAHAANNISRDLVSIRKGGSCFVFTISSSKLIIKGNEPILNNSTMFFHEAGISRFQEKRPIGMKMDLYAMHYIKGTSLVDSLNSNFISFFYVGNKMNFEVQISTKNQVRTEDEINNERVAVNQEIGKLKDIKITLKKRMGDPSVDQNQNKSQVIAVNKKLTELFNRIKELDAELERSQAIASKGPIVTDHPLNCLKEIEQISFKNFGQGCICIETGSVNSEEIKNRAFEMIKQVHPDVEVETINMYQIIVKHQTHSKLSKDEFCQRVKNVSDQFGAIVSRIGKYKECNNLFNRRLKGTVSVYIYTSEFTIPFAGMIKKAFQVGSQYSILRIPNSIVDQCILRDKNVNDVLKKWFSSNKLKIQQNGNQWFGEERDVVKAVTQFDVNPPKIPYKSYELPTETNMLVIHNAISRYKGSSAGAWYINRLSKKLFVPSSIPEKQVNDFTRKFQIKHDGENDDEDTEEKDRIPNILGDIYCCEEEAELSRSFINVFLKDGRIIRKNYCLYCIKDTFAFNLRKMFNTSENEISMEEIINDNKYLAPVQLIFSDENSKDKKDINNNDNDIFPLISFGQMFYTFINEEKLSNIAKAWITAAAVKTLRKSQYFTFCPLHPNILIPRQTIHTTIRCITPGCGYFLCCDCDNWHSSGKCTKKKKILPGYRICPYCHEAVEKSMDCNYLACMCGKAFCYYCGKGVSEGNHSVDEHGNCFNHPPDYRRFCLHDETVSNEELEKFYQEYPQWRPIEDDDE